MDTISRLRGQFRGFARIYDSCRFVMMTVIVVIPLGCTSTPAWRPPTPEQARVLDSLKKDSGAVAACAERTRSGAAERVYLESEVDEPAVILPWEGRSRPPELPRRDGNAIAVAVVHPHGRADPRSVTIVRATYFELGDSVLIFVRRAQYRPALLEGRPVAQCVIVPITVRTRP